MGYGAGGATPFGPPRWDGLLPALQLLDAGLQTFCPCWMSPAGPADRERGRCSHNGA